MVSKGLRRLVLGCVLAVGVGSVDFAHAQVITTTPVADATFYTPVTVDARKLKTTLAAALAQFPGEEIILATDINSPIVSPRFVFTDAFSYNIASGFGKPAKVDGIKVQNFANFRIPTAGVYEPARTVTVSLTQPTTEFGITLIPGRPDLSTVEALDVIVDGVLIGRAQLPPYVVSYLGVSSATPMQSVTLVPVLGAADAPTGAWIGGRVYVK